MENRYMRKDSEWSSRSGVLLNMVTNHPHPSSNNLLDESRYHSPKGGHSDLPPGNYPAHDDPGDNSPYSVMMNGNPVLEANLPPHMLMQAVNFDSLKTTVGQLADSDVPSPSHTDQAAIINGSLNMSESQVDLLEQQQAMEQAKLLQRFKELRQWQLQQQQLLMLQQQSQLMALKTEQSRVQEMITKQRQQQWGGKVTLVPETSPFVSPRRRTLKPAGIAQALADGVVSQYQQVHGVSGRGDNPAEHLQSQRGLPKPHLPDTDSEGGCNTNPELYSNPGSIDSHESADLRPLSALPADEEDGDSDYQLDEPRYLYNDLAHLRPGDAHPTETHNRAPVLLQTAPVPWSKKSPREITLNRLVKSDGYELETDEGIGTQSFHSSPVVAQPDEQGRPSASGQGHEDHENDDESFGREDEHVEEASFTNQDLDDRPVASAVGGKKTFEELLEEQLRAEEEKSKQSPRSPDKPVKRPFLRRGQGLERFKGPPKNKPAPTQAKSTVNRKSEAAKRTVSSAKATAPQAVKGVSSAKAPVPQAVKGVKNSNKFGSSKTEGKPNLSEAKHLKVPAMAPKTGQGLPGMAQKSSKSRPFVQTSSATVHKKVDITDSRPVTATETSKPSKPAAAPDSVINTEPLSAQPNGTSRNVGASFLSHLESLKENEQFEEEDLEEFEMLEHFADNASFSSNSSLVVKVLQRDRWKAAQQQGVPLPSHQPPMYFLEDHKRFFVPPVVGSGKCEEKSTQERGESSSPDVVIEDSSESISSSSDDSDTEIEDNDLLSTIKRNDLQSEHADFTSQSKVSKSDASLQTESHEQLHLHDSNSNFYWNSKKRSDSESSDKDSDNERFSQKSDLTKSPVRRKIAGRIGNTGARIIKTVRDISNGTDNKVNGYDSDSEALSPSSDEEVEKSRYLSNSQSVDRNTNNPIDVESASKEENSGKTVVKDLCEDEFDDEDEWGERSLKQTRPLSDGSDNSEGEDTLIEEQTAGKQARDNPGSSPKDSGCPKLPSPVKPSPPPTSKLITKLFPKLRPQKPSPQEQEQQQKLQAAKEAPVSDGVQSKVLREKLAELESEINKFRAENAHLERLRQDREEGLSKLKREIEDFEKEKNEELQRLNEFKTQELKKLKHEKKVFEKYQKAARAMPDKKEREEIESLRTQLSELQDELKRKESRWSSNTSRLRSRMEELEQENRELKEEIRLLEKRRLEWLQREQANKTSERLFPGPPSRSAPALGSESASVSNGYGFINTDSEEEVDPVRDEKKKVTRNPPSHMSMTKAESKKAEKISHSTNQKPDRPTSANHRPKSGKHPSSSHKSDKSNSPSKSTNQKKGHSVKSAHSIRTSLTEDLPRRQIMAEAIPQPSVSGVPSVSEFEHRLPQQSRKLGARFDVDKSAIDKVGDFEEIQHPDGKLERIFNSGAREILFSNGTRKEISSDGQSIIVSFFNGDIKQIMADQRVVYYYSEAQTTHSTYPDGLEILQFPNNQVEKHYPDGTKEIQFPDQTVKYLFPTGVEESVFTDGTVIRVESSGDKTIEFPNGQREIHTQQYKKREYPDGTVKTVFPDGRQETRYSNGRIRVKDREGNVVMDKRS